MGLRATERVINPILNLLLCAGTPLQRDTHMITEQSLGEVQAAEGEEKERVFKGDDLCRREIVSLN